MLRRMLRALQVAGEAVKDAPSWAGPDVIIATTMDKLDKIVAAANAQAFPSRTLPVRHPGLTLQDVVILNHGVTMLLAAPNANPGRHFSVSSALCWQVSLLVLHLLRPIRIA